MSSGGELPKPYAKPEVLGACLCRHLGFRNRGASGEKKKLGAKIRDLGKSMAYPDGGNSNILYVHPYLGKIPILTNIFQIFRGVETTNQLLTVGFPEKGQLLETPGYFCGGRTLKGVG